MLRLDPAPRSRTVFAFHRPEELLRLVNLDKQLRQALTAMPALADPKLWRVQFEAVANLEKSLAQNHPRSLIQRATGSGKTFTAISAIYRLIKFAGAKRILFLVDRTNLGRQTSREFQQYISPYNGFKFTDEYNVQHLTPQPLSPTSASVSPSPTSNDTSSTAAKDRPAWVKRTVRPRTASDDIGPPLAPALWEEVTNRLGLQLS